MWGVGDLSVLMGVRITVHFLLIVTLKTETFIAWEQLQSGRNFYLCAEMAPEDVNQHYMLLIYTCYSNEK